MSIPDEQSLWELEALHSAALEEVARNQRVHLAVEAALGRIAREQYPSLGNWNAEQLRKLADRISRHAAGFAGELTNLNSAGLKSD